MFITRFTRVDGQQAEEYRFVSKEEAIAHLHLFDNDDSGLYQNIAVIEDRDNTVICILLFEEGKPKAFFAIGDIVRLVPEFASANERRLIYSISNINEATQKVDITCLNSGMAITPTETVGLNMIHQVSDGNPINIEEMVTDE